MAKDIPLSGKRGQGKFAIVDDEDYVRVSQHRWHLTKQGYAATRLSVKEGGKIILLHCFIIGDTGELMIDHISGDKLDCRRSNMRLCTSQQNGWNKRYLNKNRFGLRGVAYLKTVGTWRVYLTVDGQHSHLGLYQDLREAIAVYNKAVVEERGEFALVNELTDEEIAAIECEVALLRERLKREQHLVATNTSGQRGVAWSRNGKAWRVYLKYFDQQIHLGYYKDKEEAAYIYDQMALQLLEDKASLNILHGPYEPLYPVSLRQY